MNAPVTSVEQALGHFILDSDCPTVYIEVVRDTNLKQTYAPHWVAFDLRGKVGRMCGMGQALRSGNLDVAGINCPTVWGSTEDDEAGELADTRLMVEKLGKSTTFHLAVVQVCDGEDLLFESCRLEFEQFLIEVANGRRYFGNMLTDEELKDEVDSSLDVADHPD